MDQAKAEAQLANAQTVLASAARGRAARTAGASKMSKIWQALDQQDSTLLAELCCKASAAELCVLDPEGKTPLAAAIASKKYDCARVLLAYEDALALPEAELTAWKLIQKCKREAELEDTEEPVDVEDEEWQKEQSDTIFGAGKARTRPQPYLRLDFRPNALDLPLVDADPYLFKSILKIGIYKGGRAARDPAIDPAFDSEVTERSGFGTALAPHGDIYVGRCAPKAWAARPD